jgi:hypothetical protein
VVPRVPTGGDASPFPAIPRGVPKPSMPHLGGSSRVRCCWPLSASPWWPTPTMSSRHERSRPADVR